MPVIAIPIGIGLAEAAGWLAAAVGLTAAGYGAYKGGEYLANQMAQADEAADSAGASAATDVCSTCFPPECRNIVDRMRGKNRDLIKELRKYDPVQDAIGGHSFMVGGVLKTTRPGGHYQEIRDLQRGLKNDLEAYNRSKCYDKNPSNGDKSTRNEAQDLSSRNIEVPPGMSFIPL